MVVVNLSNGGCVGEGGRKAVTQVNFVCFSLKKKKSLAEKYFYLPSGIHRVKLGDVNAIKVNIKEQPVDRFLTNCWLSLVG